VIRGATVWRHLPAAKPVTPLSCENAVSGFYPIEEKHSSIEHLFLKVQSMTLHRRKRTLRAFSRSFRYRGIRTSGFWRMDTWDWLYAAGFCRDWNEITISFLGFMALTDPVKCSVRTGWIQDACDVGMGGKGCVR